eukprot:504488-Pelagomonas_calceolata.AAC.1
MAMNKSRQHILLQTHRQTTQNRSKRRGSSKRQKTLSTCIDRESKDCLLLYSRRGEKIGKACALIRNKQSLNKASQHRQADF